MDTGKDNDSAGEVPERIGQTRPLETAGKVNISERVARSGYRYLAGGLAAGVIIALCAMAIIFSAELRQFQHYGYLGLFVISIFAGGTVIVPVPGLLAVFTLGGILHPAAVGAVAGLGEAIGIITIYLAGTTGQAVLARINRRIIARFTRWLYRYRYLAVFLMSATVNPLYYPFALLAGGLRFGLPGFFLAGWAGKTVKNTAVAYLGGWGFVSLLRWLGVAD